LDRRGLEIIETFIERLHASKPEALDEGREKQLRTAVGRLSGLEDFPFLAVQIGHEVDEERVAALPYVSDLRPSADRGQRLAPEPADWYGCQSIAEWQRVCARV
jgi:hypothetical protein